MHDYERSGEHLSENSVTARAAAAVRAIPAARRPLFCAACAERFYEGYSHWFPVEENRAAIPVPALLRDAIDFCWQRSSEPDELARVAGEVRQATEMEAQVQFSSGLSLYNVAIWIVLEALDCGVDLDPAHVIRSSGFALDFYLQLLDAKRERTGGRSDADPSATAFETDIGVAAEAERQVADAEALSQTTIDVVGLRAASAALGNHVLHEILAVMG